MKKLLSFLVAAGLFFNMAGCEKKNQTDGSNLAGQADLKLSCITEFLRGDGSSYLTKQEHEVFAKPKTIRLTAKEPFGEIIWTVRNDRLVIEKSPKGGVFDEELFKLMTDETICKALLELYLAELKTSNTSSTSQTDSLTFEGKIYEPVFSDRSGIALYKNKSTGRKDLVISQNKQRYMLFGYNYLKLKEGRHFPSKIDIYIYNEGTDKKLIAQYVCHLP
jgi:hypothetical protein